MATPSTIRVGYQGEPGAYSEGATYEAFQAVAGVKAVAEGFHSFDEVFSALAASKVDYIAVPVENTLGGSIHVNYDLMLRHHGKVHILGEHSFRVRHTLLALPGVKKEDIKKAMSHPQALAQTERYLRDAGIQPVSAYDTAGSAKLVFEQKLRDTAAIASARAAEVHGLEVLDYGIEDDTNNFTRFLILGRSACELPEDVDAKTSIVFVPKRNEVGVLHKALSCFASRDIDLSKIESRPFRPGDIELGGHHATIADGLASPQVAMPPASKRQRTSASSADGAAAGAGTLGVRVEPTAQFEYAFYVDVLARADAPHCRNALRHLEELTRFVKVLGTYPKASLRLPPVHCPASAGASATALAPLHGPSLVSPLRIAIIGFGTFGQFLAKRWVRRGHVVVAQSRTDYSEAAAAMGVTYVRTVADLESAHACDVVVVATSILSFDKVVKGLPAGWLKGKLVVDVLSVKQYAKTVLLEQLPPEADILCSHPMFGPESGKSSWHGLPLVFEQVRVRDFHRSARFLSLFEDEGCRMVKMSCEQHDALAAGSQFVTHLTGRMLAKLNPQPSAIDTNGFKALLNLVHNTCSDSFDLFYALYSHNPNSGEQLSQVAEAFEQVRHDLLTFHSGGGGGAANGHGGGSTEGAPIALSSLVNGLAASKTVAVADKAAALRLEGKKIVSLSVGEPDILPAPPVMAAAHAALEAGQVKYTANAGVRALQDAVCEYLQTKGLAYKPNQIVCSNGGKQSLLQAMLACCGKGDEVIIPAPYWVSYTQIAYLAGAEAKVVKTRAADGYCLQPADLEAALTPRTRVLVLCNPSNPTGAVHPAALLERLADVLRRWPKVVVFADEIYEQITYDEPHVAFAALPGMYERTVTLSGFSKGPAMTGFRLGYLAAPAHVASACAKVQSQNTSCPCSVSQHAAIAAVREVKPAWYAEAVAGYRKKRDYTLARLRAMPYCEHVYTPEGAFYAFPSVSGCFGKRTPKGVTLSDSEGVCLYLLEEWLLALVPGEAFGDGDCVRLSYAASMETITEAMDKMEQGLKALR